MPDVVVENDPFDRIVEGSTGIARACFAETGMKVLRKIYVPVPMSSNIRIVKLYKDPWSCPFDADKLYIRPGDELELTQWGGTSMHSPVVSNILKSPSDVMKAVQGIFVRTVPGIPGLRIVEVSGVDVTVTCALLKGLDFVEGDVVELVETDEGEYWFRYPASNYEDYKGSLCFF